MLAAASRPERGWRACLAASAPPASMRRWIIDGTASGRQESVFVDFMSSAVRAKLLRADERGIVIEHLGVEAPLPWRGLPPRRLWGMARKYAAEAGQEPAPERAEALADFAFACGFAETER